MKYAFPWQPRNTKTSASICILWVIAALATSIWSHPAPEDGGAIPHLSTSEVLGVNSTSLIPHVRVRRNHGACTVGMSVGQNENAGDSTALNNAANSGGGRGRGKRSPRSPTRRNPLLRYANHVVRKYANIVGRLVKPRFLTRTQRRFFWINLDIGGALQRFLHSGPIKKNPSLRAHLVIDPLGVTCEELCAPKDALYGLVGFCTRDYCRCAKKQHSGWEHAQESDWTDASDSDWKDGSDSDWKDASDSGWKDASDSGWKDASDSDWKETSDSGLKHEKVSDWKPDERYSCPKRQVFDPLILHCNDPRHTLLCKDFKKPKKISHGWKPVKGEW